MECNKDEASRAKSIAEAKLEHQDFAGAKKFALKAQNLYPALNGISQMLTTLEVYISSQKMINGQVDWYGVLGVDPTDDEETIKKQYRKLALMLHPDKNNFAGADGAFKLIFEAWSLLSDKDKRSAYNQITGHNGLQSKVPSNPSRPSPSTANHTESPFTKCTKRKPQKKSAKAASAPPKPSVAPANQKVESFWTICGKCKIQYEYHVIYREMTLLCPNCKVPFLATEIPRPVIKSRLPKPSPNISVHAQQGPPPPPNSVNTAAGPSENKLKQPMYSESNAGMGRFCEEEKIERPGWWWTRY